MAKETSKDIKYLGRDFNSLKKGLVDFAKIYYPNTYNDFSEASPGMMFIEMAAYVGDVLNYYIDSQLKESLLLYATEKNNVMAMASALGYKPKISVPSTVDIDIFQLLPASGSGVNVTVDTRYGLEIEPGMLCRSNTSIDFIIQSRIDFKLNDAYNPTLISVYSIDGNGSPNYYLAKKTVKGISATPKTVTEVITLPTKYLKILVQDDNLIGIDSIIDSDGNEWYEVPYLAQDTIFEKTTNTAFNDPDAAVYSEETPYLLKLKRVPRRFITRVVGTNIEIQFGAGVSSLPDEEQLASPENIGLSLPTGKEDLDFSIDPSAPVHTSTYGLAPSNTTLTIKYLVGGGISSNVPSNTIVEVTGANINNDGLPKESNTLNTVVINSLAINNQTAAVGGRSAETIEEVRQNTMSQFASQNRAVTREDYIIRAYAMPTTLGSVAKVFINPDEQNQIVTANQTDIIPNPLALNMHVLGYNSARQLVNLNNAVKENLKTYMSQYRMLTDSINIRNAYIINISVSFSIVVAPSSNANDVLLRAIEVVKDYFDINKWQINQPISVGELYTTILSISGVQTVPSIDIANITNATLGYSNVVYSIAAATKNNIIYPSLDPSIFEVKYPNADIKGRIATF